MEIRPGEFLGILGPSGSGKSSLLYLLSGLKSPTSGSVSYKGQDLATLSDAERAMLRRAEFGFVFQQPFLLRYLTCLENVVVANSGKGAVERARALLEDLGLGAKTHRYPHELSVGERQRVCVARALIGEPRAIFADEPTAALDHANGLHVLELLLRHRGDSALAMVTHDVSMLDSADRVLTIEDGRVRED